MKRKLVLSAWLLWIIAYPAGSSAEPGIRDAQVAGQFYPASQQELAELIGRLTSSQAPVGSQKPRILLVPHAGYQYSGAVAGQGFAQLRGATYDGVVLVGFTHQIGFSGASVDRLDQYQTPLGVVQVDREAVKRLSAHPGVGYHEEAHQAPEHSLEVELPFLQTVLPETPIVPVLLGESGDGAAQALAEALADLARHGDYLFVFSTDLSHYHPDGEARAIDARTVEAILFETPQAVSRLFQAGLLEACGRGPILASLYLAERLGYPARRLVASANSGDTSGDKARVVGYAAIAMDDQPEPLHGRIADAAGEELVQVARQALQQALSGQADAPAPAATHPDAALAKGVFVTLTKQGVLRGCIGRIQTDEPLSSTVPVVAVDSALRDTRFAPVTAEELNDLDIEVSVLTEPTRLAELRDLVPGRDGVILRHQGRSGVFLPQVWQETGWTRVEFLRELASQKAGLPPDAWQHAELYVFQDQAFHEIGDSH